jgi:ribonuclease HI
MPDTTREKIFSLIKESIISKFWKKDHLKCNLEEHYILQSWQPILINQLASRMHKHQKTSPTTWSPPPTNFIKINFNGASKGNPGPAGYGAILRNSNGKILCLIAVFLGETTNNVAELIGLLRGLQIAIDKHHHKIILEGDSQIYIKLITNILHRGNPSKISPSWKLSRLLEDFNNLLQPNLSIIPSHMKRDTNKIADCLANEEVEMGTKHFCWEAHISEDSDISTRCQTLATSDLQPPDGVPRYRAEPHELMSGCTINKTTDDHPLSN